MELAIFIVTGFAGLTAHWFKRWARGQTEAGFADYMLTHKRYTVASVCSMIGAIAGLYLAGDVELSQSSAALAFMAGYNIDSAVNKSPEDI
ncbi:hypothetical protein [Methylomonas sp. CM2]|uniref:hypothetical protein n=1 Tax=Methylomonas sp. CM2 TaxID=3417647 RepID=UPI003CEF0DA0